MEKHKGKVYLGYEDEPVTEKTQTLMNYTTNKIGGYPDWPPLKNLIFCNKCPLCGINRLLIIQCYAPLDNSTYHRTLYVFACINPTCWNKSESWICVRSQLKDEKFNGSEPSGVANVAMPAGGGDNVNWCSGADQWDDDGDIENGNICRMDNAAAGAVNVQRLSDEDDESNSLEVDALDFGMGNMKVTDQKNANAPTQTYGLGAVGGAAGGPEAAAAEIEGAEESGLVSVDPPPQLPQDLSSMLLETPELPSDIRLRLAYGCMQFAPHWLGVEQEFASASPVDARTNELLQRYHHHNKGEGEVAGEGAGGGGGGADVEEYEDGLPPHGDRQLHAFLARLNRNPGQILRYSRDAPPLLGAPLPGPAVRSRVCSRCNSPLISELQLLPAFGHTLQLRMQQSPTVTLPHLYFLSVLVFTCRDSCWQPGDTLVTETVIVQSEVL